MTTVRNDNFVSGPDNSPDSSPDSSPTSETCHQRCEAQPSQEPQPSNLSANTPLQQGSSITSDGMPLLDSSTFSRSTGMGVLPSPQMLTENLPLWEQTYDACRHDFWKDLVRSESFDPILMQACGNDWQRHIPWARRLVGEAVSLATGAGSADYCGSRLNEPEARAWFWTRIADYAYGMSCGGMAADFRAAQGTGHDRMSALDPALARDCEFGWQRHGGWMMRATEHTVEILVQFILRECRTLLNSAVTRAWCWGRIAVLARSIGSGSLRDWEDYDLVA